MKVKQIDLKGKSFLQVLTSATSKTLFDMGQLKLLFQKFGWSIIKEYLIIF